MSIIRSPRPESNFYVLDKSISENDRLTWAARGVLIFLLGKPDNWQISIEHLRKQTADTKKPTGRDALYSIIDELIAEGYIQRSQGRGEEGRLGAYEYRVSEVPLPAYPDTAQPDTANPTLISTEVKQEQIGSNAPSAPKRQKVTFEDGEFIVHDCDLLDAWHASYGKPHVEHEIAKAKAWVIAGGKKKKDWARFLTNWLANSNAPLDEGDCPVDKVIDLYHQECPSLPAVTVRSDRTLRGMIVDRWRESPEHQTSKLWQKIFSRAKRRNEVFYRGQKCVPRLEAIVSRAVFRELEEMTV